MTRRKSPTPEEIERINETLDTREGFKIQDRDSYDLAFDDYMGIVKADTDQKDFRTKAFNNYLSTHPDISKERLFKKAKGTDLRRDRLRTAKTVVKTRGAFIKATAPEVDLKGYDTARQKVTKEQRIQRTFTVPARVKGRVVYSMKTSVTIQYKTKKSKEFFSLKQRLQKKELNVKEVDRYHTLLRQQAFPKFITVVRHRDSKGRFASIRKK